MHDYIRRVVDGLKNYQKELNLIYSRYNSNIDLSEWQRNVNRWREGFKNFVGEKITSEELEKFNNLYKLPFLSVQFKERVANEFGSFSTYISELIQPFLSPADPISRPEGVIAAISESETLGTLDSIY